MAKARQTLAQRAWDTLAKRYDTMLGVLRAAVEEDPERELVDAGEFVQNMLLEGVEGPEAKTAAEALQKLADRREDAVDAATEELMRVVASFTKPRFVRAAMDRLVSHWPVLPRSQLAASVLALQRTYHIPDSEKLCPPPQWPTPEAQEWLCRRGVKLPPRAGDGPTASEEERWLDAQAAASAEGEGGTVSFPVGSANRLYWAVETSERGSPMSVDAFPGGVGRIPNNPVVFAVISAIWAGDERWGRGHNDEHVYVHRGRSGNSRVTIRTDHARETGEDGQDTAPEVSSPFEPMDADVLVAVLVELGHAVEKRSDFDPRTDTVTISAESLYRLLGRRPRHGEERRQLLESIQASLDRLSSISAEVRDYYLSNEPVVLEDTAVLRVIEQRTRPYSDGRPVDVEWKLKAGGWVAPWLTADRKWLASVPQRLLQMDARRTRPEEHLARKIGLRLLLLARVTKTRPLRIRVRNLLRDVGEMPGDDELAHDRQWRKAVVDRTNDALQKLVDEGILDVDVRWDSLADPNASTQRVRGFLERWLDSAPEFYLHEDLDPRRGSLPKQLGPRPSPAAPVTLGERLALARQEAELTQEVLAAKLGMSAGWLSQIERGSVRPSTAAAERMEAWLCKNAPKYSRPAKKPPASVRRSGE